METTYNSNCRTVKAIKSQKLSLEKLICEIVAERGNHKEVEPTENDYSWMKNELKKNYLIAKNKLPKSQYILALNIPHDWAFEGACMHNTRSNFIPFMLFWEN